MKKLLLSLAGCLTIATASFSQTTLFQDDFETGSSNWTLNTGSGANNWVVNNAYLGFAGLIPDTPNQPGAITNSPQSTYMHITNTTVCGGLGVCNANFDTGSASNQNTEVAASIDASSYTDVTVSFWYLCQGSTGTSFGTMEYSVDGGSVWTAAGTEYSGVSSWTQESVTLPAWDNVATFKVRFKWQNGGAGLDPAFSIDELLITGTPGGGGSNTITTAGGILPTSWCAGTVTNVQINFTSSGTFTAGNVYSAELSDATGSFAAPTVIGTLASAANSGMITGSILGSTPAGSGYRIRIVSSAPVTAGSDNGSDLIINPLPTVTQQPFIDVCEGGGVINLIGATPSGGTYSGTGVSGITFDPALAGLGSTNITYIVSDGNGCSNSVLAPILVIASPTVTMTPLTDVCAYTPLFALSGGSPTGGVYSGNGVTGNAFDPATAGNGSHVISYSFTAVNGCTSSTQESITVDACASIKEGKMQVVSIYPNPTNSTLNVSFETASEREIILFSLIGEKVKYKRTSGLSTTIDVSELPRGVYMVQIESNNSIITQRIIVR